MLAALSGICAEREQIFLRHALLTLREMEEPWRKQLGSGMLKRTMRASAFLLPGTSSSNAESAFRGDQLAERTLRRAKGDRVGKPFAGGSLNRTMSAPASSFTSVIARRQAVPFLGERNC